MDEGAPRAIGVVKADLSDGVGAPSPSKMLREYLPRLAVRDEGDVHLLV